ncbi:sugar ABC transporter substrate-binding protein [Methylopila jiangsuensis]|uniref:Sugar ABC transporter substrate-binding protein n=1 Tax=Methylopila jiangsuensis TaxID=586230 RepID=A0A9W6JHE8_9HYPH|nr:polysaccharide biosynthesis/export family protein [Methylopila jiangsuensis]MDR6286316.1 polysaccharide export outer membrane protein [Methylopila jiangsuensis]GLK76079.1 sugar ABC transporter substrate-binding protein [Methylopila jiangsuensis]
MSRFTWTAIALAAALAGCAAPRAVPPPLAAAFDEPYVLATGDRLRISVFGQPNLSNSYTVEPDGRIAMPLVGRYEVVNKTPDQVRTGLEAKLKAGFLRDPNVSVEIEGYRPFYILGEVNSAGQYPYVVGMTAQNAVAIASGFSPRAQKDRVELTRRHGDRVYKAEVPLTYPVRPGDTITVQERWF